MACDYLPNNEDIVRARKISTSMEEITFTKKMKKSVSKMGSVPLSSFSEKDIRKFHQKFQKCCLETADKVSFKI